MKTIPNLNAPDQKLKWSSVKHEYLLPERLRLVGHGQGSSKTNYSN